MSISGAISGPKQKQLQKITFNTDAVCLFQYILENHKPPINGFKIPLSSTWVAETRTDRLFFLGNVRWNPRRVAKSDLSIGTGASLAIYLCGHEKNKKNPHKVALSVGSVWYAAAGPLSSETQRGLKADTSKVASVHLHLPLKPQTKDRWCPVQHELLPRASEATKCFNLNI